MRDLPQEKLYTIDDIYELPDGERAELIDGRLYFMAPPNRIHQRLVSKLNHILVRHIEEKSGSCEVYPAPFAVFLNADEKTYVEPDISVICEKDKLTDKGCNGAPDFIIEIVSPSSQHMDCYVKLFKYRTAGVREYWIVNLQQNSVTVYGFEHDTYGAYTFEDAVPIDIYPEFTIHIRELLK